ncbi:MAG: SAM-dependent methyltransferase, partial [Chitinophagales bacterium]
MNNLTSRLLEKNFVPDFLIRSGIRDLLAKRLSDETKPTQELQQQHLMEIIAELKNSPIAIETKAANQQHYEVPTEFFQLIMSKNMKYSSCYWEPSTLTLEDAETLALKITCAHADLINGQQILELGCGWGSLTMFMAANFPESKITAVSNSATQKKYIDQCCHDRELKNVQVVTADMNDFSIDEKFDRVVSVEMFEHMRNYQMLLEKISGFLN